jgi:hypothetical protein
MNPNRVPISCRSWVQPKGRCLSCASEGRRSPHSVNLNGILTRSAAGFRVSQQIAELGGNAGIYESLTLAKRTNSLLGDFKAVLLSCLLYLLFILSTSSTFPQFCDIPILNKNCAIKLKLWNLLDPGNRTYSIEPTFERNSHAINKTMPSSVPKGSALGICKQCQVNDAAENVRSRPMCR